KGETRNLPGLSVEGLEWESHVTHFDLTLNTSESETGLWASLTYATDLFDETTIERMVGHWLNLLQGIVEQPQRRIGELPLLSEAEHRFILDRWDQTRADYPATQCVHSLIEDRAGKTPEALAVTCDDQRLTYRQLDTQANRLAHRLIELGVKPETRVAVAMHRSPEILVAFLAVLKAGGAYVPLDLKYPPDRLLYMMEDSAAALVLTQNDLLDQLPLPDGLLALAVDRVDDWQGHPDSAPQVELSAESLAYVIYTSGSTGQPKGVAVAHGPLAMHCLATGEWYEMTAADCELHFLSFAFDGAHERWLTTLIQGGRLLLRGDELWSVEQTYEAIRSHGVTMAGFPSAYIQQLAEYGKQVGNPPPVRLYSYGGDVMPKAGLELIQHALKPSLTINGYGPTETVVTPLVWKAGAGDGCETTYAPIGQCVGRRSAYVLADDMAMKPLNVLGELFIGGEGLARSYLNRPA
ncbi:AMP-binding protein, partial [Azotobacter vinelandii]|uniref:AMP-binding protein n=1 Tax=Azotobacter vinelandii TaxID=354 RepID=UPI000AC0BE5D